MGTNGTWNTGLFRGINNKIKDAKQVVELAHCQLTDDKTFSPSTTKVIYLEKDEYN